MNNDQTVDANIQNIKDVFLEQNIQILNKPIPESYSHKKFKGENDVAQTVLMSLAVEDMKQNPDQY